MKYYYKVLGVSNTATKTEIQKAYRALAMKYHPDVNGGDPKFDEILANINEAYEILKDEKKRKEYDKSLSGSDSKNKANVTNGDRKTKVSENAEFDFTSVNNSFEKFFGFDAKTGEITNEDKLKKKNPLDTSGMFEKFMGFK